MSSPSRLNILHDFFLRQAQRRPDALAIDSADASERMTYAQLEARSAQVARHLVRLGIGRDDRVALHLPRSADAYVAILGVLRAGAAYVPIDVETPEERARFTVEDSGARLIITSAELTGRFTATISPCLTLAQVPEQQPDLALPDSSPEDLCYVIYTSGTTGKPKGVGISHVNASTYVRGILAFTGVNETDRVIQGFSLAFDASVEQIWMAFAAGGVLVVGSQQMMRVLDELPVRLRELDITVFSTVPTVLGMLSPHNLPRLRLLITGGEAARAELVTRWAAPNRRLLNSYGPTETSVVATCTWMEPGRSVTIGKPLPEYEALIVDDALRPVADGTDGELCIGGPAVSLRGYLNRDDLNAQKFFLHEGRRFYRSGDLVSRDSSGELLYRGRIDTQVKIRGYRVELEEIENHIVEALQQSPDADAFQGVIVAVQPGPGGAPHLVAYLVQRRAAALDVSALLASLRSTLPAYMVPTHFTSLDPDAVPRLTSGKVDRKRLPALSECRPIDIGGAKRHCKEGRDATENAILAVWREVLHDEEVSRDESFFDLGGNSMLAVQAVTRFRDIPELAAVTVRDIYECLTTEALANRLKGRAFAKTSKVEEVVRPGRTVPHSQYLAVAAAQTVVILLSLIGSGVLAFATLYGVYLTYDVLSDITDYWPLVMLGGAMLLTPVTFILTLGVGLAAKWLLVGKFQQADHPVWSWGYFRWWLVKLLLAPVMGIAAGFVGTPLAPFFYRLLGARIGKRVYLGCALEEPDLVSIGDDTTVSDMASLRTHSLRDSVLRLRRIQLAKGVYIGCRGMVTGGVRMASGSKLHPQSCLVEGTVVPPNAEYQGSPARPIEPGTTALSRLLTRHEKEARREDGWHSTKASAWIVTLQLLHGWALALFGLVPLALQVLLLLALGVNPMEPSSINLGVLLAAAPLFAALRFACGLATILIAKWLFTGRAQPGTIPLNSYAFVRRWFCAQLMAMLVNPRTYRPITETLLMGPYFRLLGMKVGTRIEMSDPMGIQPDLVSLGNGAMLADAVAVGAPVVHRGLMTLGEVKIGDRSFMGNGSQIPITTPELGAGSLVGVATITPDAPPPGSDWLGSPPMRLPNRVHWNGPADRTFNPPRRLVALRWMFGVIKMILPGTLQEMIFWVSLKVALLVFLSVGTVGFLACLPLLVVTLMLGVYAIPVVVKWTLVGRYKPGQVYLWSVFMWLNELVFEVDTIPSLYFGQLVNGTPWLPMYYRALGAKIGKQVCLHRTILIEADLVTIGDHATLEGFPQTHLFEDRVMKLGKITIGDGVYVGAGATVLYDTNIGAWASIGDASLVMKHETLPGGRCYRGLPVENVEEQVLVPNATRAKETMIATDSWIGAAV